jgi:hypothetical protein
VRRHLRICIGLLLTIVLASCSDNNPLPTGPQEPQQPAPEQQPNIADDAFLVAQGCSPADITALVKTILPGPLGTLVAAKLALLNLDRTGGRVDRARAKMFEIVDALIKAEAGGLYANDPVKHGKLVALIKLLFCLVGLPQPPIDLGPDGGAAVITPTSPNTTVQTGNKRAATLIGTGDVPQTVLVTITKLGTSAPWLDTQLDQYGPGYEFTVTPTVQFTDDVLAGACINSTGDFALDTRLRLAHNNASGPLGTGNSRFGNIEIIAETVGELGPLGLICTPTIGLLERMFMPERLYAAGSPPTTGGKVRTYSPFAAVDPLLTVSANSVTSQSGAAGAAVAAAPSVRVVTRNGTLINGVGVGFVPTAGSGSVTGGTQTTSAGIATVGSWTINAGPNTLNATATASGLSFVGSPVEFTADGALPPPDFGATGYSYFLTTDVGSAPEGWQTTSFPAGWATGGAPFGTLTYCADAPYNLPPVVTQWGIGDPSYVLVRKDFYVPAGTTTVTIQVLVDNDVQVFMNGTSVSDGLVTHENCANVNPVSPIVATVTPGAVNKLAIIAKDRGGQSYLDLKVTLGSPVIIQ